MNKKRKFFYHAEDKETKKVKKIIQINSKEQFINLISKIKASDFDNTEHHFQANDYSLEWFGEIYVPRFYHVSFEEPIITLRKLPNGVRRTKYSRKVNNERTLKNTLKRIKETLKEDFDSIDVAFRITQQKINEEKEYIKIRFEDLEEPSGYSDNNGKGEVVLVFNKLDWTYKFIYLSSLKKLDKIHRIVRNAFEKHTASTRNYRANNDINFK